MSVQELLKYVDINVLADIRESRILDYERDIVCDRETFAEHMGEFVKTLRALTPDPTLYEGETDGGLFVMAPMPYLYTDGEEDKEEVRYEAEYMKKADWDKAIAEIRLVASMPAINPNNASAEEMEAYLDTTVRFIPQGWGYDFSPWEKVLAAEIAPGSFDDRPGIAGDRLKDLFLFDLLWNMSFNGYTREQQEERRAELDQSFKEMEEIRNLPPEEQEKHYCDAEDFFKEMYEAMGIEYHKDTEEEEAAKRIKYLREFCITRDARLKEMWRLAGMVQA